MAEKEKSYDLYIIGIVAIVAIIGLVIMFSSKGAVPVTTYASSVSPNSGNIAGNALARASVSPDDVFKGPHPTIYFFDPSSGTFYRG